MPPPAETSHFTGHTDALGGCAVSPDGTWIVSGSVDRTLRIWAAATGTERATLTGHTNGVFYCAVSPDGTWIASTSWDGHSQDLGRRQRQRTSHPHRPTPTRLQVARWARTAPGSSARATTAPRGSGTPPSAENEHPDRPHRSGVGLCGEPGRHLDRLRQSRPHPEDLGCDHRQRTSQPDRPHRPGCRLRGGPDGTWIVSGSADRTLRIWDAATAEDEPP